MNTSTHYKLVSAVTQWDAKQSTKRFYNRYALPQYLAALERAEESINAGVSMRKALVTNFCGRLLDVLLRTVGESPSTKDEQRGGI